MKKLLLGLAVFIVLCGAYESEAGNVLVAYFSRSGNTQALAEYIAESLSGDIDVFRIITVEAYPEDYTATTDRAMADYDVVFLGYPIWWGTVPMAVLTFLEEYDFSGKRVIPFNTHGGSGKGRSIDDIKAEIPEAEVDEGFAVRGTEAVNSKSSVSEWVKGLNLPESSQPENTSSDEEQPNETQQEDAQSDSSQQEASQPQTTQSEDEQQEDAKQEDSQTDNSQTDAKQSEDVKHEDSQSEDKQQQTGSTSSSSSSGGCVTFNSAMLLLIPMLSAKRRNKS